MSKEVLLVVESVSNEKGVPANVIFEALELALATATKKRFEDEVDLRVEINRHTGAYETFRRWTVVEEADLDDPAIETWPSKVAETHPGAKVGDVVEEKIESIEFGRIAAQTAKQVIVQKVREAERAQALLTGQQLAQLPVAIDIGNEEVDVRRLAVLAIAKRDGRAAPEQAVVFGEQFGIERSECLGDPSVVRAFKHAAASCPMCAPVRRAVAALAHRARMRRHGANCVRTWPTPLRA